MRGKRTLRDRKVYGFLLLVGCGVALLLAEGGLRLVIPGYVASAGIERNYFCRFDDEIGWTPLANITARHQRQGFSVMVHQNQFGLRGPDAMKRENTSATTRILVLGDSYVWGYGVDQDRIFTEPNVHRSEKELINFGVSGYGTDQEYLFYLREGVRFEVDEVVLTVTPYNDVENNLAGEQYDKLKPYFELSDQGLVLHNDHIKENKLQSAVDWVWSHSRAVNLLDKAYRTFLNWVYARQSGEDVAISTTGILNAAAVTSRDQKGVVLTVRIIEALRDAVSATGARFSVVIVPYKPHILNKISHNHPFVPLFAKELEETNIEYYEPYYLFLNEENGEVFFNKHDNHFSPTGHALFGKVLVDSASRAAARNFYSADRASSQQKNRIPG